MKFEIQSYEGAGPLRFGMTKTEVREILGPKFKEGKRGTDDDADPYDYYKKPGCFVYYGKDGGMNFVEFMEPAELMYEGENLLGMGYAELVKRISEWDPDVPMKDDGFISLALGITCYAPLGMGEPEKISDSVGVFVRGLYDGIL